MSNRNAHNISNGDFFENGKISCTVKKCIERISEKEGLEAYNVNIQDISTSGGNYLANLQEISLKGRTKYDEKEINLFVKNRVENSENIYLSGTEAYRREAFYYNEVAPIFIELQENANVPVNKRLSIVKSFKESNSDAIILEDLSKKGYQTWNRMEPISLPFAELSVKQLARFHALSFVIKDRKPEYFEKEIKSLKGLFNSECAETNTYLDSVFNMAAGFLDDNSMYKLKRSKHTLIENYKKVAATETTSSCFCHGDFRANNMMILVKNGVIKDLVIVDYQFVHYDSPVVDFIYFIFGGSDQALRKNHLDELKDLYYETFQSFLKYFDISAQNVYPKKQFEQEYRDCLDFGLVMLLVIVPFQFCDNNEVPDLNAGLSTVNLNINNEVAKKRVRDIVEDFIEWGYL